MRLRTALVMFSVAALFVYVGWALAESFGLPVTVVIMVVMFAGVLFYRQIHRVHNRHLRLILVNAVHLEMGFLSFLLTGIVMRDLIFVPFGWWAPRSTVMAYSWEGTGLILAVSLLTLAIGVGIATAGPWVVKVKVPVKNLPEALEGFKIAQLSDMHIGPTTKPSTVEWIVKKTLGLKPNVVALTGDIGDGPVEECEEAVEKLSGLSEIPAYFVTGNHEYYWNGPAWIAAMSKVGVKPLLNAYAVVKSGAEKVIMIGTPDPTASMLGPAAAPDVERASRTPLVTTDTETGTASDADADTAAATGFRVLLAHQPGISTEAREAGIDLQLSGHTHAGQFFPWTLLVKRVHEFSRGLGRTGKTWVYVNPGTGSWGPPVRLGTWTEITLLTLTKEG